MRTAFFVDGYNLFYGLLAGTPFKWLDLPSLLQHVLHVQQPESQIASISYYTAGVKPDLASRGVLSKQAQDTYIRALKAQGVEVHFGRHRLEPGRAPRFVDKRTPASRSDQVDIWQLEEKETDVHLAISMYRLANKQGNAPVEDRIDQIVLVSADTDMAPALRALREDFPRLQIGVILPHREGIRREPPGSLLECAHWTRRLITFEELSAHQFPSRVPTRKKPACKPEYW
ncbi:NYN domain-containing protein [Pseudomonas nitroreducens]|uniref:NYN domain-containing protein n=1 Tax=Pseudomonas TaxID=286 RepID=UPI000375E2D1|nr:NYN domain-containing protein [Pseudomonas nitroreducens]